MICHISAIFLTLLCTAAIAAELPPHWINVEDHNGFHGVSNPNFPFDVNADLAEEHFVIPAFVLPVNRETNVKNHKEYDKQTNEVLEAQQENDIESEVKYALQRRDNNKVACDFITSPRVSCYTCYTYIDCKSNGVGKIKQCSSPYAPYCNEGFCSATPTAECNPNPQLEEFEEASGDLNQN